MHDYYNDLGISKSATQSEIKQAFRSQSKKCHPDVGGDEVIFKQLNKAYMILSDPDTRQRYDRGEDVDITNKTSHDKAIDAIKYVFSQYIKQPYTNTDAIMFSINSIKDQIRIHRQNKKSINARIQLLEQKKGAVVTTNEVNLFDLMIEDEINFNKCKLTQINEHITTLNEAMTLLATYTDSSNDNSNNPSGFVKFTFDNI